ncbi:MAG TPA: lysophospholipid acyltransferase family protein [Candidatus Binatia bacterium]|nr:lysophospholipid acyltransferase family protein [Candidatus Binatia bacterium]
MIRAVAILCFWGISILIVGPPLVFYAALTGNANPLYHAATRVGRFGVLLVGVRIEVRGREHLQPGRNYIFMSNHVSNLDPPVLLPVIPGRCSVLVKKELFRTPIFGTGMRLGDLVPVDREHREAAIESIHAATRVLQKGLHMVIYPEGTRSPDGRLLPFKKGPFHLAMDSGVPVVPVTLLGTYESWPKTRFALRPGTATVVFHPPIDPRQFADRDELMAAVRDTIASVLPPERR